MRQKVRTAMTIGAIAAGVVSLVLAAGFVADIFVQLRESTIHSQLGHIQVYRKGFFEFGTQSPAKYLIENPDALKQRIVGIAGAQDAMARLRFSGLLNNGRADLAIVGEGVEPAGEQRLGTYLELVQGRALGDSDTFGIVLGEGVASSQKLAPGDHVTLLINTPDGAINTLDFEVVGVFRSFSKDYDARAVRIPLPAAQELLTTAGANSIVVSLEHSEQTDAAAERLRTGLEADGFEVFTWEELSDFYRNAAELYEIQFGVLRLIILGMVLLGVANSVNMSVFERYGEFGTMRALGDRNRTVLGLVLAENVLVGVAGAVVGVVLGVVLAWIISAIGIPMPPPPNSNTAYEAHIRLEPGAIAAAFAIGFGAAVAAALAPALRVSHSEISEALRRNV